MYSVLYSLLHLPRGLAPFGTVDMLSYNGCTVNIRRSRSALCVRIPANFCSSASMLPSYLIE